MRSAGFACTCRQSLHSSSIIVATNDDEQEHHHDHTHGHHHHSVAKSARALVILGDSIHNFVDGTDRCGILTDVQLE
jgi:zinc and cadmium transporter